MGPLMIGNISHRRLFKSMKEVFLPQHSRFHDRTLNSHEVITHISLKYIDSRHLHKENFLKSDISKGVTSTIRSVYE